MQTVSFSEALKAMKEGRPIARSSWGETYIVLDISLEKVGRRRHKTLAGAGKIWLCAPGSDAFPWNPQHDDLLAEDWLIL